MGGPLSSVDIFHATSRAACQERALVMLAMGIDASIEPVEDGCVLRVAEADAVRAQAQLAAYETERRPPLPVPDAPLHGRAGAWAGVVAQALLLLGVARAVSEGWWRTDSFTRGALDALAVQHGEWWRAWTALTLHLSADHLVSNIGGGAWFGYLAARQLGAGTAWLLIVVGAGLANLLEALAGPATHRSVGASTAVFTALGVMAAHTWRTRRSATVHRARRWAPLVAGLVLLGWMGSAEADVGTDVIAHIAGFCVGVLLGAWVAGRARGLPMPQWLGGAIALAWIAASWTLALRG